MEEVDAVGKVVGDGVFAGEREGFRREIGGGERGAGECVGERERDGSGAGAYVDDADGGVLVEVVEVGKAGEDGFDEQLGFRARDKDGRGDAQGEREELLRAEDVLDGFEAETAIEEALVGGLLLAAEGALGVGDEVGAGEGEGMAEEQDGVGEGCGLEVGMRGELVGGAGEGFAEGDHGGLGWRMEASP